MTQSEYLNQLITSGNLGKTLEELNQLAQGTFQSDIAMMTLSRYNRLNTQRMQGTISHDNATIEENRLFANARTILAELNKEISAKMNEEIAGVDIPAIGSQGTNISNEKTKVFISYNHKDKPDADKLKAYLEDNRIEVVQDSSNMNVGDDIKDFIMKSIRETDYTLSLVSKNSLFSAWVAMESITSLVSSDVAGKNRFIACYIDPTFFERRFVDDAYDYIEREIKELSTLINKRIELNRGYADLNNELVRYKDLHNSIDKVIRELKERLSLDLVGDNFDKNKGKLLETLQA